ncbi:MAG: hypothetical protein GY788_19645 [bacterium]|nr:hypothetical protein [bacterium]
MNAIGDERIHFYLRHKAQIDEWAAIGQEAGSAVDRFLQSLEDDLAEVADGLRPDTSLEMVQVSRGGVFLLVLDGWPRDQEGNPLVGIGVAWDRQPFLDGDDAPYVGVRVSYHHERADDLRAQMREALDGLRQANGYEASNMWVAWRRDQDDGDYWLDTAPYRARVKSDLEHCWTLFADPVDAAVKAWRSSVLGSETEASR